ncbi:MAG: glycoside hydrolase family 32 protein [Flavobacterium sp.]|uniref:glycoside hydrolase family 32 protein n=1 Tax=Flavobacterium sp. TaxID=239 RepID=UPI0022C1F934|nr:glycoside hydrolase family 32 protein [Flavobacterium sp.]MCZ8332100.1 glycoside hydrolase family 32 protein [Flavobacterium sp.]
MKINIILFIYFVFQIGFSQNKATYSEQYRPQFHFTPEAKWMNDPNGLVYFNGKYHLFYQYFPDGIIWGPMHWGHSESTDLIHWKQLPIALYPDKLGWIFSGSAVIDKNNTAGFGKNAMIAIYTYHNDEIWKSGKKNTESQAIAYSLDEGKTWTKYNDNPVLNNSEEQDFRDPKVFWHEETSKWIMSLAVGDKIKLFSSSDLKKWNEESTFQPDNDTKNLGVWECPDLFPMKTKTGETKWVLIINHGDKGPNGGSCTRYFIGNFDGKTFQETQKALWLDYGTDYYAAVTFSNVPDDKKIVLGWMSNWQYATKVPTETWRSAMTLPRELELIKNGIFYALEQKMVNQFHAITKPIFSQKTVSMPFSKEIDLSQTEITFDLEKNTDEFTIEFSNSKNEVFKIQLKNNEIITDRSQSGKIDFSETFANTRQVMPLAGEKVNSVQLILDKSSVEILLNNGRFSMTNLFFPNEDYTILSIKSSPKKKLKNLKINSVSSIWK